MKVKYGKLLELMSEYSGYCSDDERNKIFTHRVLSRAIHRGPTGSEREICLCAVNSCVTLPKDVATILKAKVDCEVDKVFSYWAEWSENHNKAYWLHGCCEDGMQELPNTFPTVYDGPDSGFYVVAKPRCEEAEDAHIIIHAIDMNDQKIFIPHGKEIFAGEYLPIDFKSPKKSSVKIKRIIDIEKTVTNHYVDLMWVCPKTREFGLLNNLEPSETNPCYKRFKFKSLSKHRPSKVKLLVRQKIRDCYHENEFVPIHNIDLVITTAQEIQLTQQNRHEESRAVKAEAKEILEEENRYNRTGEDVMDVITVTSPGGCDWNLQ